MAVRTSDYKNGQEVRAQTLGGCFYMIAGRLSAGLLLLAFGLSLWVPAARFTADGWVAWINGIAAWFGGAPLIPRLSGGVLVIVAGVVGVIYSVTEIIWQPVQVKLTTHEGKRQARWIVFPLAIWVLWFLSTATDIGTTYAGLLLPPADAAQAWKDLAKNQDACALLAIVLTFGPNWLILAGIHMLFGRRSEARDAQP